MRLHTSRPCSLSGMRTARAHEGAGARVRETACPVDPVRRFRRARERGHVRKHVCL